MSRVRAFTFTINNDTYDDLDRLLDMEFVYLCFGFEVGASNTPHIQGYIYMYDPKTIRSMSRKLPRAHLEISKGTAKENAVYTSKDNDWYEFGERPTQGRAKWELIESVMKDPMIDPHLYNQYSKMYRSLTMSEKKDHVRELYIIPESEKYSKASLYKDVTVTFNTDHEVYDGEEVMFFPAYHIPSFIHHWINGYPQKVKRGYELICIDPRVIYLYYSDNKEYRYLIKKYSDYIDYAPETST